MKHHTHDITQKIETIQWISVKDSLPEENQIVLAWMSILKEPTVVMFSRDKKGTLWTELVMVDLYDDREDRISHWIPIPDDPNAAHDRAE